MLLGKSACNNFKVKLIMGLTKLRAEMVLLYKCQCVSTPRCHDFTAFSSARTTSPTATLPSHLARSTALQLQGTSSPLCPCSISLMNLSKTVASVMPTLKVKTSPKKLLLSSTSSFQPDSTNCLISPRTWSGYKGPWNRGFLDLA